MFHVKHFKFIYNDNSLKEIPKLKFYRVFTNTVLRITYSLYNYMLYNFYLWTHPNKLYEAITFTVHKDIFILIKDSILSI